MQSILGQTQVELVEKKSRFIGLLYHVRDVKTAEKYLEKARDLYPGANHYVYAYIIDENMQKSSDDGEPSRTAGYPVLDVLKKQNLNDCLAIVIRYFGGVKLGSGGLIRAYSQTIAKTIEKATFIQKVTSYDCAFETTYDHIGDVDYIVRQQTNLKDVQYDTSITFTFQVFDHQIDFIKQQLIKANHYQDTFKVLNEECVYAKVTDSYIQTKK